MRISEILEHLNRKEWVLPPFQRDFVWNDKEKIIEFVDSLYLGYPTGSIIIWKPHEEAIIEEIRGRPIEASVSREPLWREEYILDGQQRLTTVYRIFQGDPFIFKGEEFILHFDINNEKFCFLKREERENMISFHEIINKNNEQLIEELKLKSDKEKIRAISLFDKVRQIKEKELTVETSSPLKRKEALELFIRLNTGGKPLETENLALGYISIGWSMFRREFEEFRNAIYKTGFRFDFDFFVRCLSTISFGQSLKKKMVPQFGNKNIKDDWDITKRSISRLIDFLKGELSFQSDMFIEAKNSLIPLVLIFAKNEVRGKERDSLAYAFLISYINRRYSGARFANLDKDIGLIKNSSDHIKDWVESLEKDRENLTYFEPEDIVEGQSRTLKLALFILLKDRGVKRDLLGRNFLETAASEEDKPEFHHIFPRKCLKGTKFEKEIDHITNLTIITSKSNKEILDKKPDYLLDIEDELREQHFIPKDEELYKVDRYEDFIKRRQQFITKELNRFLVGKKEKGE